MGIVTVNCSVTVTVEWERDTISEALMNLVSDSFWAGVLTVS